jgi:hypothetical protein
VVIHLQQDVAATEEYDGQFLDSRWKFKYSKKSYSRSFGIQTAALAFGGFNHLYTGATEEYDGTTWTTSPASISTARVTVRRCRNTIQQL